MNSTQTMQEIKKAQHIAVMRTNSGEEFTEIANTIIDEGLNVIEVTLTTPDAMEVISTLAKREDALVGAGTVLDSVSARTAILNGADFIVSPAFDIETAKIANLYDVQYVPGVMTVKEMIEAMQYGSEITKIYQQQGKSALVDYVKAIKSEV